MRYNPALDGIRALAVLAVVAHHCNVPGFENGHGGVDVFFVLSGFLITSLLEAEQQARRHPTRSVLSASSTATLSRAVPAGRALAGIRTAVGACARTA
ncbi:MAG: acyltransferase family protein [Lysobacteraceae bacterium]